MQSIYSTSVISEGIAPGHGDERARSRRESCQGIQDAFLNQPWPYLITAAFAALLFYYVHSQPHRPGAHWYSWLVGVSVIWPLAAALSTVVHSNSLLYALFVLQSVFSLAITALVLMVVLEYTGSETWIAQPCSCCFFQRCCSQSSRSRSQIFASFEVRSGFPIFTAQPLLKWGLFAYVAIVSRSAALSF